MFVNLKLFINGKSMFMMRVLIITWLFELSVSFVIVLYNCLPNLKETCLKTSIRDNNLNFLIKL